MGYIKDYEGGTIMECQLVEKVTYLNVANIIAKQRWSVFHKIQEMTTSTSVIYPGITDIATKLPLDPQHIPGLVEAGWVKEQLTSYSKCNLSSNKPLPRQRGPLYIFMKKVVSDMRESTHAWPFIEPVAGVADYYDVIKDPMDLRTLDENVDNDKYSTSNEFAKGAQLIFSNCRAYNSDGSNYVKWYIYVNSALTSWKGTLGSGSKF